MKPLDTHKLNSIPAMISNLTQTPLYEFRIYADITFLYKKVNTLTVIPVIYHPAPALTRSTSHRSHSHTAKFIPYMYQCRPNIYPHHISPEQSALERSTRVKGFSTKFGCIQDSAAAGTSRCCGRHKLVLWQVQVGAAAGISQCSDRHKSMLRQVQVSGSAYTSQCSVRYQSAF